MYACKHVYIRMYVCMYVCIYVCMVACMHVCTCFCMCVCMYTYVRTYVCTYILRPNYSLLPIKHMGKNRNIFFTSRVRFLPLTKDIIHSPLYHFIFFYFYYDKISQENIQKYLSYMRYYIQSSLSKPLKRHLL